jgi:uncharacterized membrane protein
MNFRHTHANANRHLTIRLLLVLGLAAAAGVSQARPQFLTVFKSVYNPDPNSALGKAGCAICHAGPPKRNVYGKALKVLVDESPNGQLTSDMLKQVENVDSDGDGFTNGDEIRQGFLPGDPASHPGPGGKMAAPPAATGSSIIPSNGFHPVFIHFPIALFLFGIFLEFTGIRKKNPALGMGAVWNLHGALASLAIVAPTGIAAWLVGGHKLEGAMLYHLCCAIGSLILMSASLIARKRVGNESKGYWALLLLAAVVIGFTGYFGGQMVYG